ncbi:hypothetical protein [uncultured Ruminococcus sp.]|uniref:hypothetical protein n=1 Tax=uncultured Ruminococcus sp. TaxID=165186 RepID=UPI0025EAC377|nr:hypothetical protein [uncultured Ruminococcus sp.]
MKTEKNNKLRGTVLFTVVAVMALLIIFLTGTLALATASSNRAHKSYSSSQASYTAKTAITGFTRAMETSEDIRNKIISLGIDGNPAVIHPSLTFRNGASQDKTIGLVGFWGDDGVWHDNQITVERETVQDPADPTNPDARIAKTEWVYYDPNDYHEFGPNGEVLEPRWVQIERVKITATARVGREESTVTAYLTKMPGVGEETEDITITTPPSNPRTHTGGIKGLNTVGDGVFHNGGRYTGGMGIGLTGDGVKDGERIQYILDNSVELDTTLSFFNADVFMKTGTFGINVNQADDIPVSQTVINGSLLLQNDSFVELDYEMKHDFTQKQIPYLYVNDALYFESQCYIVTYKGENKQFNHTSGAPASPYNVFVGTINARNNNYLLHGDLYLMDEYKSGQFYELNNKGNIVKVEKGNNYFGGDNQNNSQLYKWAYDTVNKTQSQNKSEGGNIWCNGNLNLLGGGEYDGSVRVKGDCVIRNSTHIHGDLVVGGKLDVSGNLTVDGHVYCDDITGYSADGNNNNNQVPTYKKVENKYHGPDEYKPAEGEDADWSGIKMMEYPERTMFKWHTNDHVNSSYQPTDIKGDDAKGFWGDLYYPWNDDYCPGIKMCKDESGIVEWFYPDETFDADEYAEVKDVDQILESLLSSSDVIRDADTLAVLDKWLKLDSVEQDRWDLKKTDNVLKKPVLDEADQPKRDADGNVIYRETSIKTEKKSVMLDPESGLPLENAEVPHFTRADYDNNDTGEDVGSQRYTYYRDSDRQIVSESIATAPPPDPGETIDPAQKIQKFTGSGQTTYPDRMKRENIYGSYEGGDYEGQFTPAGDDKIIKTIQEVRVDLGLKQNGAVTDYPNTLAGAAGDTVAALLEETNGTSKASAIAIENNKKMNASSTSIWNDNVITGSCVIKGNLQGAEMTAEKGNYPGRIININPQGKDIWVVLDGVTTDGEVEIHVDRFYKAPGEAVAKECGKVKFFVKGTLSGDKIAIVDKKIVDNQPLEINMVTHTNTDFGIEFYGEDDSYIELKNPSTLCGTFKCPYTDFSNTDNGKYKVHYVDEYGNDWSLKGNGQQRGDDQTGGKPVIIGNALFRDVIETKNNFAIFYTETGQTGNTGDDTGDDDNSGTGGETHTETRVIRAATGEKWFFEFYSAT